MSEASGFEMGHHDIYMMSRSEIVCPRDLAIDESSIIRTGLLLTVAGLCYSHG